MLALKPTERLAVLEHFWRLMQICGFDIMAGKPLRRLKRRR